MANFNDQFNVRARMREVFIGTNIILIVGALSNYLALKTLTVPIVLLITGLANVVPLLTLAKDKLDLSSAFYLSITISGVTAMLWLNEGLRDSAIFAYPALMTYAAILGTRVQFIVATIVMTSSTFLLGVGDVTGIFPHEIGKLTWSDPINMALILLILSFGLRFILTELKDLTSKLSQQVEEVESSRQAIQHMAHHDSLTRLPNRVLAQDRFNHAITQVDRKDITIAIMFLDLDRFKP
ncbi:MAG: diguanylate cyclase, partial [Enterobacterales bacterium]|nr:diguanylate cyclase [Enterobacterales bacterium]